MPVEQVTRAVAIDNLAICVSAWRWICDHCGRRDVFPDIPMPEGCGEFDPQRKGWRLSWTADDTETAKCPQCSQQADIRVAAALSPKQPGAT